MGDSKWSGICLLIAMGLLIGACRSPIGPPPPNEALGHWLYRTQGLVGVFPPREDVRVGDVHLYLNDPDGDEHASLYQAPRWSYLPSSELLRSGYRLRPEYPATPPDYLNVEVTPNRRSWPESTGEPGFLEPGAPIDRLRSIHLPTFTRYRSEPGELPPSWGLHEELEENYADWEAVRIRVESAEHASLALEDALRAYLERRASSFYLPASLRQNLRAFAPDNLRTVWVRIVTEVIYMRALRVTIIGSTPAYYLIDDDVSSAELGDEDVDPELAKEDLDPIYAPIARANAMNRKMIKSGTDVLPDGFIRFLSASDGSITARRVYRRAIAIGVGGLSLRVDARTGKVEELRLIGRNLSPATSTNRVSGDERAIDAMPTTPKTPTSENTSSAVK
jgi:hypothetical protein